MIILSNDNNCYIHNTIIMFLPFKRTLFIGRPPDVAGLGSRRCAKGLKVWDCPDPVWHSGLNLLLKTNDSCKPLES